MQLDNMNERELLVLLIEKVSRMEEHISSHQEEMISLRLKVREMETKVRLYAGLIGAATGAAVSLIMKFL